MTKTWYFAFILRMIAASYLVDCPDFPILPIFAYVAGYVALADWTLYYVFNRNRLSDNVIVTRIFFPLFYAGLLGGDSIDLSLCPKVCPRTGS